MESKNRTKNIISFSNIEEDIQHNWKHLLEMVWLKVANDQIHTKGIFIFTSKMPTGMFSDILNGKSWGEFKRRYFQKKIRYRGRNERDGAKIETYEHFGDRDVVGIIVGKALP